MRKALKYPFLRKGMGIDLPITIAHKEWGLKPTFLPITIAHKEWGLKPPMSKYLKSFVRNGG